MSIENIKQFFGPTWKWAITKIILGFVLYVIVQLISSLQPQPVVADYGAYGWPFVSSTFSGLGEDGTSFSSSNNLAFIADLVLPYLVLCLAVFVYGKMRKEKQ